MTAIPRYASLALLAWASGVSAQYGSGITLELSASDTARLGIEWERPVAADVIAVASAPAAVRVPPTQEAIVSAPVGGLVTRLLVAEGGSVGAGQALIELESMTLLSLQREYLEASNERALAEAQLERDRGLLAEGIVAERRVHESATKTEAARMRATQARQQLLVAGMSESELEALESSRSITAAVTLDAPFAGTVVALGAALGEQIQALDAVARVADLSRLWLEVRVPQERADAVSLGMRIRIEAQGETSTAEVIHIGQVVDPTTQTVLVRGAIDNSRYLIRAGQVLPARILAVAEGAEALAAPIAAIVWLDGRTHVFARRPNGFELIDVEIVGEDGGRVYLAATTGLGLSTEIAVRGISALKSLLMNGTGEDG